MSRQFSVVYQVPPTLLLAPAADSAGRTSGYVSLRNAQKVTVTAIVNQGNAATVLLSLLQSTDVAGDSPKAISAVPIFANQDTSTASALVAQPAGATFTTSAALKNKIVVFEFVPEAALDVANGFDCLAISTGASNASNITEAHVQIYGRYQGATLPDPLTNT